MKRALLPFTMVAFALASCGEDPIHERSCAGEAVTNCLPYEYAEMVSAEVSPDGIPLNAPDQVMTFHVVFDKCADAPRPHTVPVTLRVDGGTTAPDAGEGSTLIELVTLRDDGEGVDAVAQDGVIDAELPNPFFGIRGVPASEAIVLRFRTRAPPDCSSGTCVGGTCQSEHIEIPYRTGPAS